MALTFPATMPTVGVGSQRFEIARNDFVAPEASGRIGGMSAGSPLWSAMWRLADMSSTNADLWSAFVDSLDGPLRQFYGYDHARQYPKSYPDGFAGMTKAGGGAFDGQATTWSVDGTRTVVTLTNLPANFILSRRDYIGFRWTTSSAPRRALVRAVEGIQANSSGNLSVTVRPAVPSLVPGTAEAYLNQPNCLMRLVPKETQIGEVSRRLANRQFAVGGQVAAVQDLLE